MTPTNREELIALMVEASLGGPLSAGKPGQFGYDLEAQAMGEILDTMTKAGLSVVPAECTDSMIRAWRSAYGCCENEWAAMIATGRIDGGGQ